MAALKRNIKMSPEALEPLKLSIEHWRRLATGSRKKDEGVSVTQCALCAKFNTPVSKYTEKCKGCPVMQFTGKQFCRDTPFEHAESLSEDGEREYLDSEVFQDAAQKELEFLESLLPK